MQSFIRGIQDLPNDILRSAMLEKYALTERSWLQLLLATWDLEGMKCRVHTQEKIQRCLENSYSLSKSEYKLWLSMYTDQGLSDLKEDELFYGNQLSSAAQAADRDATELFVMVEQAQEHCLGIGSFTNDDIDEKGVAFHEECGECKVGGDRVTMEHGFSEDHDENSSDHGDRD